MEYMRTHHCTARKIPKELLLLWDAELSVDENGQKIEPVFRLEELLRLYGPDARSYRGALETAKWLARQKDRRTDHVLLVVDLQDAFRKAPYFENIQQFIRLARVNYDLICGTLFCNREETDPGYREALGWDGCNGEEAELRKTIHYDPDILFTKHGYGMPDSISNGWIRKSNTMSLYSWLQTRKNLSYDPHSKEMALSAIKVDATKERLRRMGVILA